jgi:RNA:NAD 2'-phosphotransferase (TPT1/KptA family)
MEHDYAGKPIEWTTVVEYFTKRGKPLTKEEIAKLVEEDRRQREDEEE